MYRSYVLEDLIWWRPQVCKKATQTDASTVSSPQRSACTGVGWFFGQACWGSSLQAEGGWLQGEQPGWEMWPPTLWTAERRMWLDWGWVWMYFSSDYRVPLSSPYSLLDTHIPSQYLSVSTLQENIEKPVWFNVSFKSNTSAWIAQHGLKSWKN